MRTFIAIELPQNIKDALGKLQVEPKKCGADIKWVNPNNIHLTLKFLGEINEKDLDRTTQIIEDIARNKLKFEITLSELDAFPNINHPKIIFVGIKDDKTAKQIAEELEDKLQLLNIPKEEREFLGHITIGRVKSWLNKDKLAKRLTGLKDELTKENISFTADKITLFKSTLTPKGPIYKALKEVTLNTI